MNSNKLLKTDLEDARRELRRALSLHVVVENDDDVPVSSPRLPVLTPHHEKRSVSLTIMERSYIEALLAHDDATPDHVRHVSSRLSDQFLFPSSPSTSAPNVTTAAAATAPPPHRRNSELQRKLFIAHERSGVAPSLILKRLSSVSQFNSKRARGSSLEAAIEEPAKDEETFSEQQETPKDEIKTKISPSSAFEVITKKDSPITIVDHQTGKENLHLPINDTEDDDDEDCKGPPKKDQNIMRDSVHEGAVAILEQGSWDLGDNISGECVDDYHPDAWDVLHQEWGNQENSSPLSFSILGTFADDKACQPHVLSPPLMESLQPFLPENLEGCNFWLKYSLVRDGPGVLNLLRNCRASQTTVLAIETSEGHVFGSVTNMPWRAQHPDSNRYYPHYYGSQDSLVWRMRRSRMTPCHSVAEQALMESELEVYHYTGANECVQYCQRDKLGLGGGSDFYPSSFDQDSAQKNAEAGFAIALDDDLLSGTTSPSETFGSPCLTHPDIREPKTLKRFQVVNLEVWTVTPHTKVEDATHEELSKLFFEERSSKDKDLNLFGVLLGSLK